VKLTLSQLSGPIRLLLYLIAGVPLYLFYLSGLTRNPPGFYIDEAAISYNALTIYLYGQGDSGHSWPLFFPVFPYGPAEYLGYTDPVQIYLLAALYLIFPPSVFLSRAVEATAVFLACILLGILARRISNSRFIGTITALTAFLTPWFFEIGKVSFAAGLYPLTIILLLLAVYSAYEKGKWSLVDNVLIATALALTTYTYTVGRLLGPILAFGLILFATDLKRLKGVLRTWLAYAITLIPLLIFRLRHPGALTGRYKMLGYLGAQSGYWEMLTAFVGHYIDNLSLRSLLLYGDIIPRHHVPGGGAVYFATLIIAAAGVISVVVKYRQSAWWRFVVFGLFASVVPASLTKDDFHTLRLAAFPVFMMVLTVPVLMRLVALKETEVGRSKSQWLRPSFVKPLRYSMLAIIVIATVVQAISFQVRFHRDGPNRGGFFDYNYPAMFAAALEQPERPIYLVDTTYYHALWQAAVQGIDPSNFVRLPPNERPEANSIVLSGEGTCSECELLIEDSPYLLYRTLTSPQPPPINYSNFGSEPGQFSRPQGISVDGQGNFYVADTYNGRVEKFDSEGEFTLTFTTIRDGEPSEPRGIAIDPQGNIYVTDSARHRLLRFTPDGGFSGEWKGPDAGFYGPRDIAFGPNGLLYIIDQGHTRVAVFDPADETFTSWGTPGKGDGQFADPNGIGISGKSVFVTDTGNGRVQVFDLDGSYVSQWNVPIWESNVDYYPDVAVDADARRVYVTSSHTHQVFAFSTDGTLIEEIKPELPATTFNNPTSLVFSNTAGKKRLYILNTGSNIEATGSPSVSIIELGESEKQKAVRRK
jgi:DNA-binding beta-propeller fold protein YncE